MRAWMVFAVTAAGCGALWLWQQGGSGDADDVRVTVASPMPWPATPDAGGADAPTAATGAAPVGADGQPLAADGGPLPVGAPVPMTASAPVTVKVGEVNELVIGIDAHRGIRRVSFAVRFDARVLQARGATDGDLLPKAGLQGWFSEDIDSGDGRIAVISEVRSERPATGSGTIAQVQFEAVAPGRTWITIEDIVIEDGAGARVPVGLSQTRVPVTAQ